MAVQTFNAFKADVANGVHNLGANTLKIALTNTAPVAGNSVLADIVQISATGGYAAATATVTSSAQVGGTYSLVLGDVTFTASGASFDNFRYAVLYNDSAASDQLIGWFDYGVAVTLLSGQSFTFNAGTWLTNA